MWQAAAVTLPAAPPRYPLQANKLWLTCQQPPARMHVTLSEVCG